MDPQIEKFLNVYVDKSLEGQGFAIYSPGEKEGFKVKLLEYFSDLVLDTMLQRLTDEQVAELNEVDPATEEAQQKIAVMSASIPGFIFILQDRFEAEAAEIGKTGRIPQLASPPTN